MPNFPLPAAAESAWMTAMRRGDFEAAWRETDRVEMERRERQQRDGALILQEHHLLWEGTDFTDREVLVRCRHGLGDTLQFVRFGADLRRVARSVSFLVQPPLVEFLQAQPHLGTFRNGWTDFGGSEHAVEIEVMELAYAFRATAAAVGASVPYLLADAAAPAMVNGGGGLQVGLLWAASDWDPRRSLPLEQWDALGEVPGVEFHSLQQGSQAREWRRSRLGLHPLHTCTGEIATAATAMAQLDLIITVDGMPAHLAGALGRPVWVLLPPAADWRWLEHRCDSPWYPTMRLFRATAPGAWRAVVAQVAEALAALVTTGVRPCRSSG